MKCQKCGKEMEYHGRHGREGKRHFFCYDCDVTIYLKEKKEAAPPESREGSSIWDLKRFY